MPLHDPLSRPARPELEDPADARLFFGPADPRRIERLHEIVGGARGPLGDEQPHAVGDGLVREDDLDKLGPRVVPGRVAELDAVHKRAGHHRADRGAHYRTR